jgi:hypothetical protein
MDRINFFNANARDNRADGKRRTRLRAVLACDNETLNGVFPSNTRTFALRLLFFADFFCDHNLLR